MHKHGRHLPAACEECPDSPADVAEGWQSSSALPPSPAENETAPGSRQGVTEGPGQPLTCEDIFPRTQDTSSDSFPRAQVISRDSFPRAQVTSRDSFPLGCLLGSSSLSSQTKPGLDGIFHGIRTGGGTGPAVPFADRFAASYKGTFGSPLWVPGF